VSTVPVLKLRGRIAEQTHQWPLDADSLLIGRSSRCAIHLPDGTVSKEHAEIVRDGGAWRVRDLGSRNGTRVNGRESREPVALRAGDRIELGQVVLEVVGEEGAPRVQFNEATVMGSSLRLRADQILERRGRSGATVQLVHLLADAGRLLVRPKPLAETCDELLSLVEKTVRASRYVLLLQKDAESDPVQMAARVRGGRANSALGLSRSILRTVTAECTSVLTADAASDPRFQDQHSIVAQSVRSAMAVPLFDNERVLGLLYVDSQDVTISFNEEQLELLTLIANMAAVKITNARLLEGDQARVRMTQELATAAEIQRGLLPPGPPRIPGWEFDAVLQTCFEVGGDLYDFHVDAAGRVIFLLGDVSGKGMGASLLMSSFLASARVLYDVCPGPRELADRLGRLVFASTDSGRFITGSVSVRRDRGRAARAREHRRAVRRPARLRLRRGQDDAQARRDARALQRRGAGGAARRGAVRGSAAARSIARARIDGRARGRAARTARARGRIPGRRAAHRRSHPLAGAPGALRLQAARFCLSSAASAGATRASSRRRSFIASPASPRLPQRARISSRSAASAAGAAPSSSISPFTVCAARARRGASRRAIASARSRSRCGWSRM